MRVVHTKQNKKKKKQQRNHNPFYVWSNAKILGQALARRVSLLHCREGFAHCFTQLASGEVCEPAVPCGSGIVGRLTVIKRQGLQSVKHVRPRHDTKRESLWQPAGRPMVR
jgi:hypothetical protein